MRNKFDFIAIILARGGSKGIKFKNLIKIKKKHLIFWTIKHCINSKKIKSVWVSSDNLKILNYSKKIGANIIKRPKKYALDRSTSEESWIHAIKFLENKKIIHENIVGLQPTSPLRNKYDIDEAIIYFKINKFDSLFTAQPIRDHFIWKKKKSKLISNYNYKSRLRRQDIEESYLENGSFYIFNRKKFLKCKNRLFGKIGVYKMNKINSLQIDDEDDIKIINSLKNT